MFTGIIEHTGKLERFERSGEVAVLELSAPGWDPPLQVGESLAVQGVCLTITSVRDDRVTFDLLQETIRRTNLGHKALGERLNLERALALGDTLGGHLVTGHVDGVGAVRAVRSIDRDWELEIACDEGLLRGMVPKGSIALEGISLTIVELLDDAFTVHLIPYTWEVTSLSELKEGDPVTLETDVLGKYVQRLLPDPGSYLQRR
jgi:riboflavin synthase